MAIIVINCSSSGRWGRRSMAVLVVDGGGGKWRVCRRWPSMSTSTLTEVVVVNGGWRRLDFVEWEDIRLHDGENEMRGEGGG